MKIKQFSNQTIKTKLVTSFALILVLMIAILSLSVYQTFSFTGKYSDVIGNISKEGNITTLSNEMLEQSNRIIRDYNEKDVTAFNKSWEELSNMINELDGSIESKESKKIFEGLKNAIKNMKIDMNMTIMMAKENPVKATDYYNLASKKSVVVENLVGELANKELNYLNSVKAQIQKEYIQAFIILVVASLIVVICSIVYSLLFSNRLSTKIKRIGVLADNISKGDLQLGEEVSDLVNSRDELDLLQHTFFDMKKSLNSVVKDIIDSSNQVSASATDLASNMEESKIANESIVDSVTSVSDIALEQADFVSEALTKFDHVNVNIGQTIQGTQSLNENVALSSQTIQEGKGRLNKMVSEIQNINGSMNTFKEKVDVLRESSNEIGQVVELIQKIAEQTNLLSLNASIEAARAGEAGRGFSVVAGEIRNLAESTRSSTKKIEEMIKAIQKDTSDIEVEVQHSLSKSKETTLLANDTITSFEHIENSNEDVSELTRKMVEYIQEVSEEVEYVNQNIQQLNENANTLSANSQNTSAVTEEQSAVIDEVTNQSVLLQKMAQQLQKSVEHFKL
jgi:methyl-accepting chemotaxis protein